MSEPYAIPMKWVRRFSEGSAEDLDTLGGKGANLAELTRLGVPVPPGFVITTDACRERLETGELPEGLMSEIETAIGETGREVGRRFADASSPLLVSVRSGAPTSMPGMMETILNVGLGRGTLEGFADEIGDRATALDCLSRLMSMYAVAVGDVEHVNRPSGLELDLGEIEQAYENALGKPFPHDPWTQLEHAIDAVFRSWNSRRAKLYRRYHKIPATGTAVVVQAMVFGNIGQDSGTGVAFTRNPSTGEPAIFGDYLADAQGEDIVAGSHNASELSAMLSSVPDAHARLAETAGRIEQRFRDMCEIEFTVERGRLWILQARRGQRSATAAVKIAVDLAESELIAPREALSRVDIAQLEQLLYDRLDAEALEQSRVLATGIGASPGIAIGTVALTSDEATEIAGRGESALLVRSETRPDDLDGILASSGLLTTRGGKTSHAAVVTRGLGKPCVCGAEEIEIDADAGTLRIGGRTLRAGESISIDGESGRVIEGRAPIRPAEAPGELQVLLGWSDEVRELAVDALVASRQAAVEALDSGADGLVLHTAESALEPLAQPTEIVEIAGSLPVDLWPTEHHYAGKLESLLEGAERAGIRSLIVDVDSPELTTDRDTRLRLIATLEQGRIAEGATEVRWEAETEPDPDAIGPLAEGEVRALPPDLDEGSLAVAEALGATRILVPHDRVEVARLATAKRRVSSG